MLEFLIWGTVLAVIHILKFSALLNQCLLRANDFSVALLFAKQRKKGFCFKT
jgi:hypothetical protein